MVILGDLTIEGQLMHVERAQEMNPGFAYLPEDVAFRVVEML